MESITKVGAAIIRDKKEILINRNKKSPIYMIPGGKVKEGETTKEALKRELEEETGIVLTSHKFFKSYQSEKALFDDALLILEVYIVNTSEEPIAGSEILENVWLNEEDYKNKKYKLAPLFKQIIPDLIKEGILEFKGINTSKNQI